VLGKAISNLEMLEMPSGIGKQDHDTFDFSIIKLILGLSAAVNDPAIQLSSYEARICGIGVCG